MGLTYDAHIHTYHCGCANETMTVPAIVEACAAAGNAWIAVTDHLNSAEQLPLHRRILADIRGLERPPLPVYFGVELNFTGPEHPFVWSEQIKADAEFQFAIGGVHSIHVDEFDVDKIIEIQHRHHLLTCEAPGVDILVHPWWFGRHAFKPKGFPFPPFETVRAVPESMTRELGQAAVATGTTIEINAGANIFGASDDYVAAYTDYMAILADEGVTFSLSTDAHDIGGMDRIALARALFDRLDLGDDRLWQPTFEPVVGPA